MNNIKTNTRPDFFAKTRQNGKIKEQLIHKKNNSDRKKFLDEVAKNDVRVQIDDSVKDFSKIKKMVENVPEIDNQDKIARLKQEISEGKYQIDYDALADRILNAEF